LFQLIRPNDIAGLFGTKYRALSDENKKEISYSFVEGALIAWMDGKPLSDLERDWNSREGYQT
jgi:hypothetical protein